MNCLFFVAKYTFFTVIKEYIMNFSVYLIVIYSVIMGNYVMDFITIFGN
jgi:hypothetical protein